MEFSKWPYICEKFDQIINTILKGFPIDPVKYLFALISTLKHSAFDKLQTYLIFLMYEPRTVYFQITMFSFTQVGDFRQGVV